MMHPERNLPDRRHPWLSLPLPTTYTSLIFTSRVVFRKAQPMHPIRPHPFALRESIAGPSMRLDLIARVRREIEEGTYETPEKLEIALERLFAAVDSADPR